MPAAATGRNLVFLHARRDSTCGASTRARTRSRSVRRLAVALAPLLSADRFRVEPVESMSLGDASMDVVISSAVLHFARDDAHWLAMVREMWRVLAPGGMLFARLATSVGQPELRALGGGRYRLPDGSARYLVDHERLLETTAAWRDAARSAQEHRGRRPALDGDVGGAERDLITADPLAYWLTMQSSAPFAAAFLVASSLLTIACHRDEPSLASSIRRGHALLVATRDSLPRHVGNNLRCTSCHLNDGRQPNGIPWLRHRPLPAVPQPHDAMSTIETAQRLLRAQHERLGHPVDSHDMRDMVAVPRVAYRQCAADDTRNKRVSGHDAAHARHRARRATVRVHLRDRVTATTAQGTAVASPALWGDSSYNIGAGMARLRTAASFIRHNMPLRQRDAHRPEGRLLRRRVHQHSAPA